MTILPNSNSKWKGQLTVTLRPAQLLIKGNARLAQSLQTYIESHDGWEGKNPILYLIKLQAWFRAMGYSNSQITVDPELKWHDKPLAWILIKLAWLKYIIEGDSAFDKE